MSEKQKDHLAISQRHIFSKDEKRYTRADAHTLIAIAQELRKLNRILTEMHRIIREKQFEEIEL
jgi:hypothetical protein